MSDSEATYTVKITTPSAGNVFTYGVHVFLGDKQIGYKGADTMWGARRAGKKIIKEARARLENPKKYFGGRELVEQLNYVYDSSNQLERIYKT